MADEPFVLTPLTAPLGAEVSNIDLSEPLDDASFERLHAAWIEHKVLFFRDQELTPEQHKNFAHRFGEFQPPGFVPTLPDHPEVRRQEQPSEMGIEANIVWHSDDVFLEIPSKGSLLWALEVPEKGGDTVWCDMELAYEGLSNTMKRIVVGLRALHVPIANMQDLVNMFGADAFARMHKKSTPVEHPVVRTHPETGRSSLFVNELNTTQIVGMTRKESDNLLQFLFEHSQQPDYQCRFSWRKGSAAFWDNRCTMHRGLPNFTQGPRLMHRVAIADSEPPIYAPTD